MTCHVPGTSLVTIDPGDDIGLPVIGSFEKREPGVPFLETPDNFPGSLSIFSSSFNYQLIVIIGAN